MRDGTQGMFGPRNGVLKRVVVNPEIQALRPHHGGNKIMSEPDKSLVDAQDQNVRSGLRRRLIAGYIVTAIFLVGISAMRRSCKFAAR